MASTAALLLAAGESTRMGELKALLPWRGSSLLEHQLASLASAGVSRTVVVLGYQPEKLQPLLKDRPGVECVHNPDYRHGKTTSIKAGLNALGQSADARLGFPDEAVLVLNVDQPRSPDTVRRIIELHHGSRDRDSSNQTCLITVPTYRGKGGHPIVLSPSLIDELMKISEDTLGLKALVLRHMGEVRRVEIDSSEILLDLNTPQDYRKALQDHSLPLTSSE